MMRHRKPCGKYLGWFTAYVQHQELLFALNNPVIDSKRTHTCENLAFGQCFMLA